MPIRLHVPAILLALHIVGCATRHDITQVDSVSVHMFRREQANSYLLVQGDSMVLVDSGLDKNAADLDNDIHEAGFDPKRIRALILTHGHADHAGGAKHFKEKYGVPVVAGAGDREMLLTGKMDHLCATDAIGSLRVDTDQATTYASTTADIWIDARKSLAEIGGVTGEIVPLPGHTKGSLVVLIPNAAFVGICFEDLLSTFRPNATCTCATLRTTMRISALCWQWAPCKRSLPGISGRPIEQPWNHGLSRDIE